jgi:hypothetical protein
LGNANTGEWFHNFALSVKPVLLFQAPRRWRKNPVAKSKTPAIAGVRWRAL